jgi:hypothetical protein
VINADAASSYLGFDIDSPGVERVPTTNGSEMATFRAMSLTAKGLDVRNARVRMLKSSVCRPVRGGVGPINAVSCGKHLLAVTPFSIGTDLMKRLHIYVSAADKKVYFARNDSAGAPTEPAPAPSDIN